MSAGVSAHARTRRLRARRGGGFARFAARQRWRGAINLAAAGVLAAPLPALAAGRLTLVAGGLDNPRKLTLGGNGALYVVEAGHGGRDRCLGQGAQRICVGLSGAVAQITDGKVRPVLSGLPSWARPDGEEAEGAAAVLPSPGGFDVLFQDATIEANGFNTLGPDGAVAGDLVSSPPGRLSPALLFNFAAFEAARDPDHGAGPGARYGDPAIDSDPYALIAYRGGFVVADAAGNDLISIARNGRPSVLAVFPTQTEPLTAALDRAIGAPSGQRSIRVQSVPTSVAVGPDGALYVGELGGLPFEPGRARIWRVVPGHAPTLFASGFTTISDLAFAGDDLLVLEMTREGLLSTHQGGALIRLAADGRRTVLAAAGLLDPTGLAVEGRVVYIATNGNSPARGASPHGEVVKLTLPGG